MALSQLYQDCIQNNIDINVDRVLFIGDIHIKRDNLYKIDRLIEYIESNKIDADIAVLAGDVLDTHERVCTQLMNKAYQLIGVLRLQMPVVVLVGNHDYINNSQFCSDNHWMFGLEFIPNVVVASARVDIDGILFVPYVPTGMFTKVLGDDWKDARFIFAHQEMRGCKMGPILSSEGDEWDEADPIVISGHIHERQVVQKNVYYPGSVVNHSFGYDCQGMEIFTLTRGKNNDIEKLERKEVDLGFDKNITIYTDTPGFARELQRIQIKSRREDSYRFSVEGTRQDLVEFKQTIEYKNAITAGYKIVFKMTGGAHIGTDAPSRRTFPDILARIIKNENDKHLTKDYEALISK